MHERHINSRCASLFLPQVQQYNYTVSLSLALGSSGSGSSVVTLSLVDRGSGDKAISNTITLSCSSSNWTRFSGVFVATDFSANASLSIAVDLQSDVNVRADLVILEPGEWGLFNGLPGPSKPSSFARFLPVS